MNAVAHPAKFTDSILERLGAFVDDYCDPGSLVLDPFAGVGNVHRLGDSLFRDIRTVGIEIEPEWAASDPRTIPGSALSLPFHVASFDAVVTSPTYGNRMADSFEARDSSRRLTYRHLLGRRLHPENSGQLQWGRKYQAFHIAAWREVWRVLKPGGVLLLNMSNHVRRGRVVDVVDWHFHALNDLGFVVVYEEEVPTPRMRFGENYEARVDTENISVWIRA